jgi:Cof subfamily protein (haloacid dehalogenase superfamily)
MMDNVESKEEESSSNNDDKKKYRMVALDLDGTLLGSDHRISDASVQHLRKLHEKGFIISIATGRSAYAVAEVIQRLNFQFTKNHIMDGFPLVCVNGAKGVKVQIKNQDEDEEEEGKESTTKTKNPMVDGTFQVDELFHTPVPQNVTEKTLALAKKMNCVTNYYINHDIYAHPKEEWHYTCTQKYSNLTGVEFTYKLDDYKEAMSLALPSKLLVLCKEEDIDTTYEELSTALCDEATVIRGSPPFIVEVLNKSVCKGNGLEKLCETMGVSLNDCISFGDGDNDVEFLQMSGLGLAMKNARDSVKAIADDVTEWTNSQDGVILTLQRLEEEGQLHFSQN